MSNKRTRLRKWGLLAVLVIGLLAFGLVAIASASGGRDAKSGGSSNAKKGGSLTYLSAADVDFIDPGRTYYTFGYMVSFAANRTLMGFKAPNYETPIPDLAASAPKITNGNKTITVSIKKGVYYSPFPGNSHREVVAADIKYAFERAFMASVASGYSGTYFGDIVGAPKSPGKYTPISGITTSGKYKLVINLTTPVAQTVAAALVMPITSPVPKDYALPFDQKSPSTYNTHVVFSGPYMVKSSNGNLTGYQPGRKIELVRNPNWKSSTDPIRPAYLDKITIQEGNTDAGVSGQRTLRGKSLACCDAGQPPAAVLQLAEKRFKNQLGSVASGGSRWVALNTRQAPFDNLNVRKAVVASFDRNALRLTRGGALVGPVAMAFIPPGVPGFKESGGTNGFSDLDFLKNPSGNLILAKKYMLAAKSQGVPNIDSNGQYIGPEIAGVAANATPGSTTALVAQRQFAKLGFRVKLTSVTQPTLYTRFCGVPKTMADDKIGTCINVGWFKDFNDPQSLLDATFNGNAILETGNVNWSLLDNKPLNEKMAHAALLSGDARAKAWAEVNHDVAAQAPAIPYIWDTAYQLASSNVLIKPTINGKTVSAINGYNTAWDLSLLSLK